MYESNQAAQYSHPAGYLLYTPPPPSRLDIFLLSFALQKQPTGRAT